ncbi:MAG: 4-hydroxy-tetrahydrodipicolinate synthase [Puniceicoccales bacterium]|jgi:4-hydroxy-tetrahydrodipicolinate synthase|nr:4-hydroxy-tetrahydrodipicolinate synthase [Puniceicoccales bacterium]
MLLKGVYTALVTPFINGGLAFADFEGLIATQSDGGVDGVVVCGTTGESTSLSDEEFVNLIEIAVSKAGRMRVLAGVGSCNTADAVKKTEVAHDLGVTGMLAVTPCYVKPTQLGLLEYYDRIADATDKPIILYSNPSRAGVEIAVDTIVKLREQHGNIVGLKEATENCGRVEKIVSILGEGFSVFSGNDSMTLPFMSLGAVGVIGVIPNLEPQLMSSLVALARTGDFRGALRLYHTILPVMGKLFIETNPLPVKFLLKAKGVISSEECRSPMGRLSEKSIVELSELAASYSCPS